MNALNLFPALLALVATGSQQQIASAQHAGTLEAVSTVEIRAPFNSTILDLIPQGEAVKKGDLLLKLDTSELQDQREQQLVTIARLKPQITQLENQISQAKQRLVIQEKFKELSEQAANLEREALTSQDGEFATHLKILEVKKQAVVRNLQNAKLRNARFVESHKKGASGVDEVAQSAADLEKAESELSLIDLELKLLTNSKPLKLAQFELKTADQNLKLTSEIDALKQMIVALAGEREANRTTLDLLAAKLTSVDKQFMSAAIKAPADGILLYGQANLRRGVQVLIEEGAVVRERQTILRVADMSRLQVRVLVSETSLSGIKFGQPVSIRFDADQEKVYEGSVKEVGSVPSASFNRNSNEKQYLVVVTLPEPAKGLRVGMTALVEFKTD